MFQFVWSFIEQFFLVYFYQILVLILAAKLPRTCLFSIFFLCWADVVNFCHFPSSCPWKIFAQEARTNERTTLPFSCVLRETAAYLQVKGTAVLYFFTSKAHL